MVGGFAVLSAADVSPLYAPAKRARSSDLLALIHDLSQPLTVVSWLLSLTERTAELPEVVVRRIELATREVDYLKSLLRDAIAADVESSEVCDRAAQPSSAEPPASAVHGPVAQTGSAAQTVPQVVDLSNVVQSIVAPLMHVRPGAVNLQLASRVLVVIGELAFRRVLNNVIDNALRAGGEAGRLWIRVESDGSCAVLSVEDDGPGFGQICRGRSLGLLSAATLLIDARGSLELGQSGLGGVRVTVRLPAFRDGGERP
jgi:signal transduction histidine kinase